MNITGKMSVFPVKFKYKDGNTGKEMTGVRFETNLSHKNEDGTYSKGFTIRVEFTKECLTFEQAKSFKDDEVYMVEVPPRRIYDSGRTMATWYADSYGMKPDERAKFRSKTFPGVAKAMTTQWVKFIKENQ